MADPGQERPAQERGQQPPGVHPLTPHHTPCGDVIFAKCEVGACFVSIAVSPPARIRMIYFDYSTQALQSNRQAPRAPDTVQNKKR